MSKPTNFIEIGMPLVEWQGIRKRLLELDIDPDPFQKCVNYGKLSYDIVKIKFGYWKKEKLIPENYMKM
ncbi:MAG TPA: hypothetical protein VIG61_07495 [Fusobacterium sp.]|uniref:hypothetical protein n=1 Tax=Fusobacterium sp. TaxID=68766 RepID=UPI002F3F2874